MRSSEKRIFNRKDKTMREVTVTLPELGLIAGTRAIVGAGIGFLLADRLSEDQRKAVGWSLLLIGAVTTIPLAVEMLGKIHHSTLDGLRSTPRVRVGPNFNNCRTLQTGLNTGSELVVRHGRPAAFARIDASSAARLPMGRGRGRQPPAQLSHRTRRIRIPDCGQPFDSDHDSGRSRARCPACDRHGSASNAIGLLLGVTSRANGQGTRFHRARRHPDRLRSSSAVRRPSPQAAD